MTLTQLKYTLAVAEEGNFTQAAEKCFVTQPTLSMQVQKLEEELDIELFNRKAKPITLTATSAFLTLSPEFKILKTNRSPSSP